MLQGKKFVFDQQDGSAMSQERSQPQMTASNPKQDALNSKEAERVPSPYYPLPRPVGQLLRLPLRYRWEVTRRHPYYLDWWQQLGSHIDSSDETLAEREQSNTAFAILGQIGVSSANYDPSSEFADIARDQPIPAWMTEGIQLQTFSNLAGILVGIMPSKLLSEVGKIMIAASAESDCARVKALADLHMIRDTDIHRFTGMPIVCVSPHLSVRTITEQITRFVNEWRGEDVPERRVRDDKFDDYFAVWDRREGWKQGSYSEEKGHSLSEVARTLGIPVSTASKRYSEAFELITGHKYTLSNWIRAFGVLLWSPDAADAYGRAALRRRAGLPRSSGPKPVPESMIAGGTDTRPLTSQLAVSGGVSDWEIQEDIVTLIRKGKTDQEIADELELNYPEIVSSIRRHMAAEM